MGHPLFINDVVITLMGTNWARFEVFGLFYYFNYIGG